MALMKSTSGGSTTYSGKEALASSRGTSSSGGHASFRLLWCKQPVEIVHVTSAQSSATRILGQRDGMGRLLGRSDRLWSNADARDGQTRIRTCRRYVWNLCVIPEGGRIALAHEGCKRSSDDFVTRTVYRP